MTVLLANPHGCNRHTGDDKYKDSPCRCSIWTGDDIPRQANIISYDADKLSADERIEKIEEYENSRA